MSSWAELTEEVVIMLPYWPLLIVLAVGIVVAVALANGRRLFPGTFTCRQTFWCTFKRQPVDVSFRETVWDGRRTDVARCSAFDPPTAITCDKACLRQPVLPAARVA